MHETTLLCACKITWLCCFLNLPVHENCGMGDQIKIINAHTPSPWLVWSELHWIFNLWFEQKCLFLLWITTSLLHSSLTQKLHEINGKFVMCSILQVFKTLCDTSLGLSTIGNIVSLFLMSFIFLSLELIAHNIMLINTSVPDQVSHITQVEIHSPPGSSQQGQLPSSNR